MQARKKVGMGQFNNDGSTQSNGTSGRGYQGDSSRGYQQTDRKIRGWLDKPLDRQTGEYRHTRVFPTTKMSLRATTLHTK